MKTMGSSLVPNKVIEYDGVVLQTEDFGDPSNPPVLLIMGLMASMLWWPDRFCKELAARGRYVIRYDQRDTGLSTHYPQGEPGYTFDHLVNDAIAILDGFDLASAHLVGMSMGGMIAQQAGLRYPGRVRTLTLISTSPLGVEHLPPPTQAYQEHSAAAESIDWTDLEAIAGFMARDVAMLAGTRHPHDARAAAALIERDIARAPSFATASNHLIILTGEQSENRSATDLKMPVLVIHGTADPLFPIAHGEAFTRVVPHARLHRVEGGGHEIHSRDIDEIVGVIAAHTEPRRPEHGD